MLAQSEDVPFQKSHTTLNNQPKIVNRTTKQVSTIGRSLDKKPRRYIPYGKRNYDEA